MSITEEWMKKMWQIYAMGFYSAMKENQTVSFVGKSMKLEMFMLKKSIQTQKDKHCTFLSYAKPRCKCADICASMYMCVS